MAISKRRLAAFDALLRDPKWVEEVLARAAATELEPYGESSLAYWLKLDTWTRREGLMVLSGIDPKSVVRLRDPIGGMTFEVPDLWDFDTAQPFSQPPHFTLEPFGEVPEKGSSQTEESFDSLVERIEKVNSILDGHRQLMSVLTHVLDRSLVGLGDAQGHDNVGMERYAPARFIAWATSIRYTISWLTWATEMGFVGSEQSPFVAPFFDADASDYPELLAIAVRAWEHARRTEGSTPKQRVLEFLDKRYPTMLQGSRDAIAQVVNWQRTGGRPATKQKT